MAVVVVVVVVALFVGLAWSWARWADLAAWFAARLIG